MAKKKMSLNKRLRQSTIVVPRSRLSRIEMKYFEFYSNAAFAVGGTVSAVNSIAQGADFRNRIGNVICMTSLCYDFLYTPAAAADANGQYTFHIVHDRQANNILPNVNNILDLATAPLQTALLNLAINRNRFRLLKTVRMGPYNAIGGAIINSNDVAHRSGVIKLPANCQIAEYVANVGGIPSNGAIYVVTTNSLNGAAGSGNFSIFTRVFFTDD